MNTKISLLTFILASAVFSSCKNEGAKTETTTTAVSITMKGSDTVLPLAQKEAENFMKENAASSITVTGGGSGVGISALQDGTTDIAMASRDLKAGEKLKLQEAGKEIQSATIAYDALAVVVNPANKVQKLTREQIEGIFTGSITNWKEVGGDDEKIIVYSRESSSGTYEFFKEHVMDKKNYASTILSLPATGAIVQSVGQTKGAIAYVGLAYLDASIKTIEVSYDQGKVFVAPSVAAAKDGSYPVSRPLFYFYDKSAESKVKAFVDYALSDAGQALVAEIGYVPLK